MFFKDTTSLHTYGAANRNTVKRLADDWRQLFYRYSFRCARLFFGESCEYPFSSVGKEMQTQFREAKPRGKAPLLSSTSVPRDMHGAIPKHKHRQSGKGPPSGGENNLRP